MQENAFFLKKPLGKSGKHLYYPAHTAPSAFPGSSAVEHSTVNRQVAGSNPARGATFFLKKCDIESVTIAFSVRCLCTIAL